MQIPLKVCSIQLYCVYRHLIERVQEEVINKTPTTDEIDLVEREQEEAINETPTTDEIDLIEREEEVIN